MTAITAALATESGVIIGQAAAEAVCGVDFCDRCGCCINCFAGCCPDGCRVVVYEDQLTEWLGHHDLTADPFQREQKESWPKQPMVPEGFWTDVSMLPPPEAKAITSHCVRLLRYACAGLIAEEPSSEVRRRVDAALIAAPGLVAAAVQGGRHQ
jgi:hypothetical protein